LVGGQSDKKIVYERRYNRHCIEKNRTKNERSEGKMEVEKKMGKILILLRQFAN